MALRMMSPLPARISQVLQDYLPAELDLIDTEEADGITTPDILVANYYEWDQQVISHYPACSMRTVSSQPHASDASSIMPNLHGRRASVDHRIDVMFHVNFGMTTTSDPLTLQKLLHRYINAAMRVLCIMHWELDKVANPVRFVETTRWVGEAIYGPENEQDDGDIVRTGTLPLEVWTIEARG